MQKYLRISKKSSTFAPAFREKLRGAIAQLVEQRTENPCVPGSIPGGTTSKKRSIRVYFLIFFLFIRFTAFSYCIHFGFLRPFAYKQIGRAHV